MAGCSPAWRRTNKILDIEKSGSRGEVVVIGNSVKMKDQKLS
jgi:hypothetical protein